jgi:hypothetical protein
MFGKKTEIEDILKKIEEMEKRIAQTESYLKAIQDDIYDKMIELEKMLGPKKFTAVFQLSSLEDFNKLSSICSEIASKDGSFVFLTDTDNKEISVFSENKNELHKKCMWLVTKTGIEGLKYRVEPRYNQV